jgi:hypothetical protein
MGTRRVVLGQQNDGTYGFRVSAPGIDAFAGDGQGGDFTFNSAWTDIAKIHAVGIATYGTSTVGGFWTLEAAWPDLGYKPFIEARRLIGSVVYDDWYIGPGGDSAGVGNVISSTGFKGQILPSGTYSRPVNFFVVYIAYKIPVPTG